MDRFIDKCVAGLTTIAEIDDFVDEWHKNEATESLAEWLGMTESEYDAWLFQPEALIDIVANRRAHLAI